MPDFTTETLLYRNQFVLGSSFIEDLEFWKRIKINKLCLTVHPGLNVCQVTHQNRSIALLGSLLNSENPQADDLGILQDLLSSFSTFNDLLECAGKFGGRWILIVDDGQGTKIFNDPTGLRQVFFTDPNLTRDFWCASQPGLIGKVLELTMDDEAVHFIQWAQSRSNDYRWPGDSTPYKEVKHLMPNHYLDLATGITRRFWPNKPLHTLSLEEAVRKIPPIFSGLMQSASNRFDLVVALSAGWDSRLMLAACKEVKDRIRFMTVQKLGVPHDHPDVTIPYRLALKLGLTHDVVKVQGDLRDEFLEAFNKNVPFPHVSKNPIPLQAQLDYYQHSKVQVVGNVSEVARCPYRQLKPGEVLTPAKVSALTGMEEHPFAVSFFDKWLRGLDKVYNLNILDLLHWELKDGNWLAMDHLEYDIAWRDTLTPYNTRSLLVNMLSVDEKFRKPPKFELYERLISCMWPETLSEVIYSPRYKRDINYYARTIRQYAGRLKRKVLSSPIGRIIVPNG